MALAGIRKAVLVVTALLAVAARAGAGDAPGAPPAFCPADASVPDPSRVAPVALDAGGLRRSFRYAFEADGAAASRALVGISHEYTCHIAREGAATHPELAERYCSLANVDAVLDDLVRNGLNVFRIYGVFNHGLGLSLGEREPYPFEQPFVRDGSIWDLSRIEPTFLERLERVVRAAYCRRVIVELTLLDPWDGDFASGPFAAANTLGGEQGLARKVDFLRRGNRAQAFQKAAVTAIVERLKPYPNLIWEVANEPDFAPEGITVAEIAAFERMAIEQWIVPKDASHLIMVNGHQEGAFGWELPRVAVASAHYADVGDRRAGAIEMLDRPEIAAERARVAFGFNEGKALGSSPEVDADDVRAEAWEFLFAGGSLFDAYSVDRGAPATRAAAAQLGVLARLFRSGSDVFDDLTRLAPARCGKSGWCDGLAAAHAGASGCPAGAEVRSRALMSDDGSRLGLYVHRVETVGTPGAPQGAFRRFDAVRCGALGLEGFVFRAPSAGCWRLRWIDPRDGATLVERALVAAAGAAVPFPLRASAVGEEASDAAFFAARTAGGCPGASH